MKSGFLTGCIFLCSYVSCLSQANLWTAFTGPSDMNSVTPVHGTQGQPSPNNTPGTRQGAATWTDTSGNLWLFGGVVNANFGAGSDLWKYNITTQEWTWMHGPNTGNNPAVYGVQGVSAPANNPGNRLRAGTWTDHNGDLWLFGAAGSSSDDLWKYSISSNAWTWMKGSNGGTVFADFGIKGIASVSNTPGPRSDFISGTDRSGNLWLFGGYGSLSQTVAGPMADLWKFDITTNNWTWINGTPSVSINGNYIQKGTASPGAYPGARYAGTGCVDTTGNFWIFGGNGYPQTNYGILNDLWMYNFSSGLWTWAAGSHTAASAGSYGTLHVPAPTNTPPMRFFATMTSDKMGNIWLFGGNDGTLLNTAQTATHSGNYNDLWRYNTATSEWTWMTGSSTWDQQGVFGTTGVPAPGNTPGARHIHQMWQDNNGGLWVFGGNGGIAALPSSGWYSDVWRYASCNPAGSAVNPSPSLTVNNSSLICLGEATTLSVTGSPNYTLYSSATNANALNTPYAVISPTQTTTYSITATDAYNCTSKAVITISVSTCESIAEINTQTLAVYPNPFHNTIRINSSGNSAGKINVFDSRGQLVFSGELRTPAQELDLGALAPGIYFMRLANSEGASIKLLKE